MSQSSALTGPVSSGRKKLSSTEDAVPATTVRTRSNRRASDTAPLNTTTDANAKSVSKDPVAATETPARMPRKRTAGLSQTPGTVATTDLTVQKTGRGESSPPLSAVSVISAASAASAEPVSALCLCQPDPKIPRPRNAFILYRQHHQQIIIAQSKHLSNPEISKIAGELWRAEPDAVKNEWKLLANEEKARHAQQYPDYRFQPRHKNKGYPATPSSERVRCQKCGGQTTADSPFATPLPSAAKDPKVKFVDGKPTAVSAGSPPASSKKPTSMMINTRVSSMDPRYTPTAATTPGLRRYPDSALESSDPKRRRYEYESPSSARPEQLRTILPPTPAYASYPSPRTTELRRPSLPPSLPTSLPDHPHHSPRNSIVYRTASPPGPPTPHSSTPAMGPPPPRVGSLSGRAYPSTPMTAAHAPHPHQHPHQNGHQHILNLSGGPGSGRGRDPDGLRLAPLLSPVGTAREQARSIEAMIMSIPVLGKLASLKRIAPPLSPLSHSSAAASNASTAEAGKARGAIVAIEADSPAAATQMLKQLETFFRRAGEFDVRIALGPAEPPKDAGISDYLSMIVECHGRAGEMVRFVTGTEAKGADAGSSAGTATTSADAATTTTAAATTSEADTRDAGVEKRKSEQEQEEQDTDMEEGEITESPSLPPPPPSSTTPTLEAQDEASKPRNPSTLQRKKALMNASIASFPSSSSPSHTSSTLTSSTPAAKESEQAPEQAGLDTSPPQIPLLLLPSYILTATDRWASALPITDLYSPADHWTWAATLWRGVVGADVTVFVRDVAEASSSSASSGGGAAAGSGPSSGPAGGEAGANGERKVEIREEMGGIFVRREGGLVEEASVRRVAFEVGEWVRGLASGGGS